MITPVHTDWVGPLEVKLLENSAHLVEIDHWLSVLNWSNGWHYDLDIVWLRENLKAAGIKPGMTVLDAGAGLGITQFLLAAAGYEVISLDYAPRRVPKLASNIFKIRQAEGSDQFDHEYLRFMNYGQRGPSLKSILGSPDPRRWIYGAYRRTKQVLNPENMLERLKDHSAFGSIQFLRGSFNEIPLGANSVDAIVSVSAFEHNNYENMGTAAKEFLRVLKPGGVSLVTTSLSKDKDWYYEPSKSWNLTQASLADWFDVRDLAPFDYDACMADLRNSPVFKGRINYTYRLNANNGLPWGDLENAQYLPVGIRKWKEKN